METIVQECKYLSEKECTANTRCVYNVEPQTQIRTIRNTVLVTSPSSDGSTSLVLVSVIIALLVIIGAAGVFFYKKMKTVEPEKKRTEVIVNENEVTARPSLGDPGRSTHNNTKKPDFVNQKVEVIPDFLDSVKSEDDKNEDNEMKFSIVEPAI